MFIENKTKQKNNPLTLESACKCSSLWLAEISLDCMFLIYFCLSKIQSHYLFYQHRYSLYMKNLHSKRNLWSSSCHNIFKEVKLY